MSWSLFSKSDTLPTVPSKNNIMKALESGDKAADSVGKMNAVSGAQNIANSVYHVAVALMLIYLVICGVITAVHIAKYGDNPQLKEKAFEKFRENLIAIAILGGISTIIKFAAGFALK